MLETLGTGILFGLSAGLAPGPLLALVISTSLRHGLGQGVRVAMAPLVTDLPIVVISLLAVGSVAGSPVALGLVSLVGAGFVAWLALDTARAGPPSGGEAAEVGVPGAPRSLARGALVNVLSPHPWLTWLVIGAPTLLGAWASGGAVAAGAFLLGFYGCLVGSKVGVAVVVARARGRVVGRGYVLTMRVLGVLLAAFALGLAREAVSLLLGL